MRVIIIEDEAPAASRLKKMLQQISNEIDIVTILDSVEAVVKYLRTAIDINLIFMDIQLADGVSFSVFEKVEVRIPVIFTTAYDQYALQAFKVNSIDYLLKPIDSIELQQAIEKYKNVYTIREKEISQRMMNLLKDIQKTSFKERLLIKRGQQLSYLKTENVSYFFADGKFCYAVDLNNAKFLLDQNLAELEEQLNPAKFNRINRKLIVNIDAIVKIHTWLGGRLKLELLFPANAETVVSREKVNSFKNWLGGADSV